MISIIASSAPGLSPLTRGTHMNVGSDRVFTRFIPAGAGNTWLSIFSRQDFAVYPRWRGEHTPLLESGECYRGLSPLARGTLFVNCVCHGLQRFIPAGAGNTERRRLAGFARRFIPAGAGNTRIAVYAVSRFSVYPRWRGEHSSGSSDPTKSPDQSDSLKRSINVRALCASTRLGRDSGE